MVFLPSIIYRGSGGLLIQSTLASLGYEVELAALAKVAIPTAIVAVVVGMVYFIQKDKLLLKKFYKQSAPKTQGQEDKVENK